MDSLRKKINGRYWIGEYTRSMGKINLEKLYPEDSPPNMLFDYSSQTAKTMLEAIKTLERKSYPYLVIH